MEEPDAEPTPTLPDSVRRAAARVAERATLVRLVPERLDAVAATLTPERPEPLPEEHVQGDERSVVAHVLAWNAVNFGSGWFPHLDKDPGLSGARTLAARFLAFGVWHGTPKAEWLATAHVAQVAAVFDQRVEPPVDALLDAFARAWQELGQLALDEAGGDLAALVEQGGGSAAALAERLATLPSYADVHTHDGEPVPLYKRAQITASHLHEALGWRGLGRFDDLDTLTAFADNLVPHVLRIDGALEVDGDVVARIDCGDLFTSGERAEVELRAVAVHAVEQLAASVGSTPAAVDHHLWQRGQAQTYKARPRHRCRCTYY